MTSLSLNELIAKWHENFRKARADLEAKAAAGDVKAQYLLRELDGEPVRQRVDYPIPETPPKPWSDVEDRDPGEEG